MGEMVKPKAEEAISFEDPPAKLSTAARERIRAALEVAAHDKK
jgi:hypothetical protein